MNDKKNISLWSRRIPVGVICLFLLLPSLSGEDVNPTATVLANAKSALLDGHNRLAEERFGEYLEAMKGTMTADLREEVVVLLFRAMYEQGKHKEILGKLASASCKEILGRPSMIFWKGLVLHETSSDEEALKTISEFNKQFPKSEYNGRVERLRAWSYLKLGKREEALKSFAWFDKIYGDSPEGPANLLEWSKVLMSAGRSEKAVEVLTKLGKMSASRQTAEDGRYWLARALRKQGMSKEASAVFLSLGTNDAVSLELRAESWYSISSINEATTNIVAAMQAASNGIELANSVKLKEQGLLDLGRLLIGDGKLDEGLSVWKSVVTASPEDPDAGATQLKIAGILLDNGKNNRAVDEYQFYLETFTNATGQAQAYYGRGWALLNDGRYAESATCFMKSYDLFEQVPKRERSLFKAGDAYFANGQYKLSIGTYERVLKEFPEAKMVPNAKFQLAESYARSGAMEKAEAGFRGIVSAYSKEPLAEKAMLRIAEMKKDKGLRKEVIADIEAFIAAYPKSSFIPEALYCRGTVLYTEWRFTEALKDFKEVVTKYPTSVVFEEAYYREAMCLYWVGRDTEALAMFRNFLDRYAGSELSSTVQFWVANYHFTAGEHGTAKSAFLEFVEKHPKHGLADDALLMAGRAAFQEKDYRGAIEVLSRILKEYGDSTHVAEARFMQANALCQLGKYPEAILTFEEIINKYSESAHINPAWMRKGDCQFMLGGEDAKRYAEAVDSYRVVANSSGASRALVLEAQYRIGRCFFKQGQTTKAFDHYYERVILEFFAHKEKGIEHDEESKLWFVRAAFAAADIMEEQGKYRRAVSILERIRSSGVSQADEAEERIKKLKSEHWWLFH